MSERATADVNDDAKEVIGEVVEWFARRKMRLVVEPDPERGDYRAAIVRPNDGRVIQQRYGVGVTPEAAAVRARQRYEQEQ